MNITFRTALLTLLLNPSCQHHRDITVYRSELLGSGAAGLVYKGQYKGEDVAIKVHMIELSPEGIIHALRPSWQYDYSSLTLSFSRILDSCGLILWSYPTGVYS